ncbi:nucleotide exchange factor GrpE [Jeongeupia chitinilytica]|uniref:Protein GrpE n=1 Tax=Jeongeupia chitinilytica TaxID=1041641 RepID=A0ABQ3H522_9NEIS|nr:nucleotide exchange factor GrpE [Jeongeupia chitinilytica]GHD65460.1 protein GrpE [Jeongeupia chitinilytica]
MSTEHKSENLAAEHEVAVTQDEVQGVDFEAQLSAALTDLDRARQDVLYAKAEMDNVRRRAAEENDKARKFAVEKFARELLSVKDAMEMALLDQSGNFDALKMGVDLTNKALVSAFEKFELIEVAPAVGDKLDPNVHQAISTEPAQQEPNTIVRVLQKGYTLSGRVLRPAMVIVAAA